jgi:hypothetical protein
MKWTVTLVAETEPGHVRTHELGQIEREDTITPASLGLSIAEGKTIVAALQSAMVTAQVERHGEALYRAHTAPIRGRRKATTPRSFGRSLARCRCACAGFVPARVRKRPVPVCRCCRHGSDRSRRNCCI